VRELGMRAAVGLDSPAGAAWPGKPQPRDPEGEHLTK
jgi:hypothetical protein